MKKRIRFWIKELLCGLGYVSLVIATTLLCFVMSAMAQDIPKVEDLKPENVTVIDVNEYSAIFDNASEEDFKALQQVIYCEAAGCGCEHEVLVSVAETVLNRVLDPNFKGKTIYDICHAKGQFVCKPYKTDAMTQEAIDDAISQCVAEGLTVLPSTEYVFFSTNWKMQKGYAKDFVWVGPEDKKGFGHWYGKAKK